tara:strand:- start:1563 stop:2222 length:660 start_codon:yes stop_codon:yes gene_type:complete
MENLFSLAPSSKNVEILLAISLTLISGLSLRISLSLIGQKWINTFHHTLSYILLPAITLVITKVISGNLALSLGMIGALSIVRFRNPVKNPFELVMFFALITIGISMAVNWKWGILLTVVIILTIMLAKLIEKVGIYFGYDIYSLSFEEGLSLNLLEVFSKIKLSDLEMNKYLLQTSFVNEKEKKYYYRLGSRNREEITRLKSELEENDQIINIDIRLN